MPISTRSTFKLAVLFFVSVTAVYRLAIAGPIHDAAKSGDVATVEQLLASGTDVNEKDAAFNTALHLASDNAHLEVIRVLVEKGSDINAGNLTDRTPLHNAVRGRHADVVQILIVNGADVNKLNEVGMSPLDDTADWGVPEIAKMLKGAGARCGTSHIYSKRCKEIEAQSE
jgi:ankyrin repeat protein